MTEPNPKEEFASGFDLEEDPLKKYSEKFFQLDSDPLILYEDDVLMDKNVTESTEREYLRTFMEWRRFMRPKDRHFACPNVEHVLSFIRYLKDAGRNSTGTIQNRLMYLNAAYEYWQKQSYLPHPHDYNPIKNAKKKAKDKGNLSRKELKDLPRIEINKLRQKVGSVTHLRDRAIICIQLKLGLRATEVCNIKLSEIHISNVDVQTHYEQMGQSSGLKGRENAVFIPSDRDGNKSRRPRTLPLDDELRRTLLRYLLIRPDNGEPWLFLSKNQRTQLQKGNINDVWKDAFHPEYSESEEHRPVTSHFGRHRFTTYWRVEQDMNRELIRYMRGDTGGPNEISDRGAIDEYIHTYYEDIEPIYRQNIFKLNI